MTFYYSTRTWNSQPQTPQVSEEAIDAWKPLADTKHWRITTLPNGSFPNEYQDIERPDVWTGVKRRATAKGEAEAISGRLERQEQHTHFIKGPKVVKTFK